MKTRQCLITNDVETTSIINHRLSDDTARYVLEQGMPRLLDLYAQHQIRATFFFTAHIARLYPQLVRMALQEGHEIGSHGLTHDVSKSFDAMPHGEQLQHLKQSKQILEDIAGCDVIAFRAPAARVPKDFPSTLLEAGYLIDSSVAPQRLDMFFSFGSLNKLHWITAPRKPYISSSNNIFHQGEDGIFEIPISAIGIPYIGTTMRIAPWLNRATRRMLFLETKCTGRPFVFLTHPNEFIDEPRDNQPIQRRATNLLAYIMGDVVRHALKVCNLGEKALPLFEHELCFFDKYNFSYISCSDLLQYYQQHHA